MRIIARPDKQGLQFLPLLLFLSGWLSLKPVYQAVLEGSGWPGEESR